MTEEMLAQVAERRKQKNREVMAVMRRLRPSLSDGSKSSVDVDCMKILCSEPASKSTER